MAGFSSELRSVVQTANDLRTSIETWYPVSGKMNLFHDQLRRLSDDLKKWEDQIKMSGLSNDKDLLQNIRETQIALNLFEEDGPAQVEFETKPSVLLFPYSLESTIQKLITFSESFSRARGMQIEALARNSELLRVPRFSFTADRRYIPLIETEEKLKKALRNRGEPSIILLHGGSGTGKSALVRNLALHFQQEAQERSRDWPSHNSQSSNSSGAMFERVLYLECGREVSLEAKQLELVEQLDAFPSNYETTDADANRKSRFNPKLLSALLKERSLLIILDDVWTFKGDSSLKQPSFLRGMIHHSGKHVKWLITSQCASLCNFLYVTKPEEFYVVGMEEVKPNDARRILASHVGLRESEIPRLQGTMDQIISETGAIPLALACVGRTLSLENNEMEDWKQLEILLNDLHVTLRSTNALTVQDTQSRSYKAAIEFCLGSLSPSQKHLIDLMQMCNDTSVPSGVIEYLFKNTAQPEWCESFSQARNELEEKQLLTIKRITNDVSGVEESFSIHNLLKSSTNSRALAYSFYSLVETFVEREYYKPEGSASKLECDVLTRVACLYLNEDPRHFVKGNSMTILPKMSGLADLRKGVISPIINFFMWIDGEQRTSALQVFLTYINDGTFEEVHTSNLLYSSLCRAAVLQALANSAFSGHHPAIGKQITSTLLTLLECQSILVVEPPPKYDFSRGAGLLIFMSIAFATSFQQSKNDSSATQFTYVRFQTVLDRLTSGLLRTDQMNHLCVVVLAILSMGGGDIQVRMIHASGLLQNLVTVMGRDDFSVFQTQAAQVLRNLATTRTGLLIAGFPGVLKALWTGLLNPKKVELQIYCASTLANLADSNDEVRSKILTCEGVLGKLVSLLVEGTDHEVEKQCARVLANLAKGGGDIKIKMTNVADLVQNLMIVMGREDSPDIQAELDRALSNLAMSLRSLKIVDLPEVSEALQIELENLKKIELQDRDVILPSESCRLRKDVQELGWKSFEEEFDPNRILCLYAIHADSKSVEMSFLHVEGMTTLVGVGVPFSTIIVDPKQKSTITIEEGLKTTWRKLWMADHSGSFFPLTFEKQEKISKTNSMSCTVGSSVAFDLSAMEAATKFGVGMEEGNRFIRQSTNGADGFNRRLLETDWLNLLSQLVDYRRQHLQVTKEGCISEDGTHDGVFAHETSQTDTSQRRSEAKDFSVKKVDASQSADTARQSMVHSFWQDTSQGARSDVQVMKNRCDNEEQKLLVIDIIMSEELCKALGKFYSLNGDEKNCEDELVLSSSHFKPHMRVEFLCPPAAAMEDEFEKKVNVTLDVEYQFNGDVQDPFRFGWYQNGFRVSFGCEVSDAAIRDAPPEVLSPLTSVNIESTINKGKSTIESSGSGCEVGVQGGFERLLQVKVKGNITEGLSHGSNQSDQMVQSSQRRCLQDTPVFTINNISGFSKMEYKMDLLAQCRPDFAPQKMWVAESRHDYHTTGMFCNVPVCVKGTWQLEGERHRFHTFQAEKELRLYVKTPKQGCNEHEEEILGEILKQRIEKKILFNHSFSHFQLEGRKKVEPYKWVLKAGVGSPKPIDFLVR